MTRKSDLLGALAAGGIVMLFCLVLLAHDPLLFWNDDYELSILPVFADVARSWSEGHLPLLSPYSWVCGNLAGEFQYGTFSVFVNAAVVLIWKFPLTFPQQAAALSITHLFVLAMGGYMLARGRNLAPPFAAIVAAVAALNGWIVCWGAIDWFGALGAFAWLPWAWWGMERALDPARGRWRFVWPAPFVYLVITGGFPYTVVMLAVVSVWLCIREFANRRRVIAVWPLAIGLALGVGMSAPAWLALFDYVRGSAREAQDASAHLQWRLPFAALPGFILPSWTVGWTDFSTRLMPHTSTELACGVVPPAALIAGIVSGGRSFVRRIKWELALLVVVLCIAMLPSANMFRWSFRWLPLLHVILALCAAEALQMLAANGDFADTTRRSLSAGLLALVLVGVIAIAARLLHVAGDFAWPLTAILLGGTAIWAALPLFSGRLQFRRWAPVCVTVAALLATYMCIPPNCGVPKYNLSTKLNHAAPLDPARLYLSVYPAPEHEYRAHKNPDPLGEVVRPGSTSMWGGVRFLTGYSPIRPAGVARAYNCGIHGEIDFAVATRLLQSEAGAGGELAFLGVDGVIVAGAFPLHPQPDAEWQVAYASAEGTVYHRIGAPLGSLQSVTSERGQTFSPAAVRVLEHSRNYLTAHVSVPAADAPALVIISRPFFRGYRARVGNRKLDVQPFRGMAPAVVIPAGTDGMLVVDYFPSWLLIGELAMAVSAVVWISALVAAVRDRARA